MRRTLAMYDEAARMPPALHELSERARLDQLLLALLGGRAGGQTLRGGTEDSENLTLSSTAGAAKGFVYLGSGSALDEANNRLGIGTTTPQGVVDFRGAGGSTATFLFSAQGEGERTDMNLGGSATGDRQCNIDLIGDDTYDNYGARWVRSGGADGDSELLHRGTGAIRLEAEDAGSIELATYGTTRLVVDEDGDTTAAGALVSESPSAGVGYAAGAGASVTQPTDKSTDVEIHAMCGQITMAGSLLAAAAIASFIVDNNYVRAGDVVVLHHGSGGTVRGYAIDVCAISERSFQVNVTNRSGGDLTEIIVLNFAIFRAVSS